MSTTGRGQFDKTASSASNDVTTDTKTEVKTPTTKTKCLCGKRVTGAVWICCSTCNQWYHCECVCLGGLSKESVEEILKWDCFKCFRPTFLTEADLVASQEHNELRKIIREEMCAVLKDGDLCTNTGVKKVVKSYSDALKSDQKEAIEANTGSAVIKEVCKSLNVEEIERQKKKKNVVVTNVPEAPSNLSGEDKKDHDIRYLCSQIDMNPDEIATCFRAGAIRKDESANPLPRPLVVVTQSKEIAESWHNEGKGYNIENHWINPDLCRADREAQYFLRQERRKRTSQREKSNKESVTTTPDTN